MHILLQMHVTIFNNSVISVHFCTKMHPKICQPKFDTLQASPFACVHFPSHRPKPYTRKNAKNYTNKNPCKNVRPSVRFTVFV